MRRFADPVLVAAFLASFVLSPIGNVFIPAAASSQPSIRSIEKKLNARRDEMNQLKARLVKNKKRLKTYRGKRLDLKVKILKLRVRLSEFHMKIESLQIKEIRDRRSIDRLDGAIASLDGLIKVDMVQKGSLDSRLLNHQAWNALSRLDGTDISPERLVRSYDLESQTEQLARLVDRYQHKKNRLKGSRDQLRRIKSREQRLLGARQREEAGLAVNMKATELEISLLKKRERSIHEDDRSILRRRNHLMALILKLERMRKKHNVSGIHRNPPVLGRSLFRWPVDGKVVEKYGPFHDGIDIASSVGSRVHAAWAGKVLFARAYSGYGRLVILEHGNHLYTLYGHLDRIFAREGQHVPIGGVLGTVGQGGTQGQPTLFFGVTRHGHPLSPMGFLSR